MAKNQKTLDVGKIRNYDEKCFFFEISSFQKPVQEWEGAKYAGSSRPSSFYFPSVLLGALLRDKWAAYCSD